MNIKNITEPTPNPETLSPGLDFLAELKGMSNAEQFAAMSPKFALALKNNDSEALAGFAGTYSGFGFDLGVPVPGWAKTASRKFWDGMGFDFLTAFKGETAQIGKLVGLLDLVLKTDNPSKPMQAGLAIAQHGKLEAVNSPPDTLLEFAKARKGAAKIVEIVQAPSQRTIIYAIIAAGWRDVEKYKSTEDLYNWLMSLKNTDSSHTLSRATESREIRKICNRIGLKFQNKWTDPKQ